MLSEAQADGAEQHKQERINRNNLTEPDLSCSADAKRHLRLGQELNLPCLTRQAESLGLHSL